ncbi:T9SS type A sorting domain-containing protein, partial [bacterium]|nr:T9SS type A sorting domain-containing protein [bacterium]
STNGFLTFSFYSAVTGTYTNPTIPTNDAVDNVISAFWDDLDGATGGEVYYQTSGSDFIVQFDSWPTYGGGSTKTFQYVLSSDGTIKFYYNTMNGTNSSTTVGIENHNGSDGIQVIKNASYIANSLAVEFTNPLSWLVVNPGSGSIEEVANQNTSVEINTTGLATGTYTATVNISSNDDTNPTETISVSLTVTNPPPSSDDSDTQSVSGSGTVNFVGDVSGGILATLTNEGAGDLGNVTITVDDDASGSYGGVTILDRHFTVTSENPIAPGGAVLLEFHVTQAELDAAGIGFADLVPYDCDFTPCQGGFPTSSAAIANTPPNNTGIGKATPPSSNSNSSDVVVAGWFTSFSPFVLGDQNDEPLPVTLSGFEGEQVEKSVLLTWKTESEVNNQGFRLYRSTSETGNYLKIADFRTNPELVGQANSSIAKTYRFRDFEVELEKTYFYKLADVDFDNVETLHEAISIYLKSADTKPTEVFDYKLSQNHPNPFNPTTEIAFSIQKAGFVNLEIFNILGQKVKSLVSEEKEAGNYNVFWDGNDENGKVVSSGIYFYTIKAGNFSDKKKMVLLK